MKTAIEKQFEEGDLVTFIRNRKNVSGVISKINNKKPKTIVIESLDSKSIESIKAKNIAKKATIKYEKFNTISPIDIFCLTREETWAYYKLTNK